MQHTVRVDEDRTLESLIPRLREAMAPPEPTQIGFLIQYVTINLTLLGMHLLLQKVC